MGIQSCQDLSIHIYAIQYFRLFPQFFYLFIYYIFQYCRCKHRNSHRYTRRICMLSIIFFFVKKKSVMQIFTFEILCIYYSQDDGDIFFCLGFCMSIQFNQGIYRIVFFFLSASFRLFFFCIYVNKSIAYYCSLESRHATSVSWKDGTFQKLQGTIRGTTHIILMMCASVSSDWRVDCVRDTRTCDSHHPLTRHFLFSFSFLFIAHLFWENATSPAPLWAFIFFIFPGIFITWLWNI